MTPNLDKYFPWWKRLRADDPFTLIDDRHEMEDCFDGHTAAVGDTFTKWFSTNEPPRVFRIVAVHPERDGVRVYECRFVGFAPPIKPRPPGGEGHPVRPLPRRPTLNGGEYIAVARARELGTPAASLAQMEEIGA